MSKIFVLTCLALALLCCPTHAQHLADAEFNAAVAKPAYTKNGPRMMFDEAHYNYHTSTERYKPFVDLLSNDGYRVVRNREPFTKKALETFKVLVIVDALADDIDEAGADKPAFTPEEVTVVRDWVRSGGALLLVADVGPFANAAAPLSSQFGVEMAGRLIKDSANAASEGRSDLIVYSRDNHLLLSHPITQGRGPEETLKKVIVFSGQSLKGPDNAFGFLKLADSAVEVNDESAGADGGEQKTQVTARSQGLALKLGNGRVVVLADAEMLTALLGEPPEKEPIGMNYQGSDNKQFTLNVVHWLSGLLSEK
ncbi:MAG: hypothetical protein C5B55_08420 [Blastocatellia bacterium]|nr:MAG: hypothetical protein C5B55_08420 [Blastocatellia bacterium]